MAIDTAQKRMSVFELPGLMTNPFPFGSTNTQPNRQQMADIYAGILASAPMSSNETCWTRSGRKTGTWVNAVKNTSIWVNENKTTKVWVPEDEVVPCPDS